MKYLLLIVPLVLFGCKESVSTHSKEQIIAIKDSIRKEDSIKTYHNSISAIYYRSEKEVIAFAEREGIPSADTISYQTKGIKTNILSKRNIVLKTLKIDTVLHCLFPGNIYTVRDGREIIYSSFWNSPTNKNTRIASAYIGKENDIIFPADVAWESRFEDSFYYSVDNKEYFAFFFSSFESRHDIIRVGRFSCAVYGVAVFRKVNTNWVLEYYNPAIGCFGMFGNPQKPIKFKLGSNKYGFILKNGFTGLAMPIYNDLHLFLFEQNIPEILVVNNIERSNALFSHWETVFETNTTKSQYNTILLSTMGYYNVVDIDSFLIEEKLLDKSFYQLHDGKNYSFIQKRSYRWKINKYILSNESFSFKSIPLVDTVHGNPYN